VGRSKGLSGFHVSNRFSANFSADLPSGDHDGVVGALLGGWQLNGIIEFADGNPVNIELSGALDRARTGLARGTDQGPSLRPGASANPVFGDGRNPDKYWDNSSFYLHPEGFFGDLGRDTGIGPGFANLDFSVVKNFTLREEASLQFRLELFNVTNRANFGQPSAAVISSTRGWDGTPEAAGRYRGAFGRISRTTNANRQIQLGLKLLF